MSRLRSRGPGNHGPGRRLVLWGLGLTALLALFFHYRHAYSPRERAAVPDAADVPARWAAAPFDVTLWVPYPHQNLEVLDEAVGGIEDTARAWGEALDFKAPELPHFGPFRAPPARELTLAADLDGRRFAAAARVYPAIALIARLAGKLVGNPWLAGGKVEISGRPARVRWQRTLWTVTSVGVEIDSPAPGPSPGEPALAHLHLGPRARFGPRGRYALRRRADRLVLGDRSSWSPLSAPPPAGTLAVLLRGEDSIEGGDTARGAVVFEQRSGLPLPRMAVFHAGNGQRWKLPAEGVLELLRGDLPRAEVAGGELVGLDSESLGAAQGLEAIWSAGATGRLREYGFFRPRTAVEWSGKVAEELEKVPLVGERHAQRWRAWQRALAPFQRYESLELIAGSGAGELVVELTRQH